MDTNISGKAVQCVKCATFYSVSAKGQVVGEAHRYGWKVKDTNSSDDFSVQTNQTHFVSYERAVYCANALPEGDCFQLLLTEKVSVRHIVDDEMNIKTVVQFCEP